MPRARRRSSRREDAAILLPFFGVVLLMPPILNLFVVGRMVFGAPPALVYLFAVWVGLIVGAILLSRAVPFRAERPPRDEGEPGWKD